MPAKYVRPYSRDRRTTSAMRKRSQSGRAANHEVCGNEDCRSSTCKRCIVYASDWSASALASSIELRLPVGAGRGHSTGKAPVLVTSAAIRPFVRGIVERFRAQTSVLAQSEIHPRARLKTVASI